MVCDEKLCTPSLGFLKKKLILIEYLNSECFKFSRTKSSIFKYSFNMKILKNSPNVSEAYCRGDLNIIGGKILILTEYLKMLPGKKSLNLNFSYFSDCLTFCILTQTFSSKFLIIINTLYKFAMNKFDFF